MIQTIVVAIPGLVALIVCILRGPELALLDVYLPVLLLLPERHWLVSGQFAFTDTTILPIAAFLLFRSKLKWRWNITDFLVIAYIAITIVAEGMNKGYKEGSQNLALGELTSILLPYLVGKQMFQHPHFAVDFAKRMAVLLTIVSIRFSLRIQDGLGLVHASFRPDFSAYRQHGSIARGLHADSGTLRPRDQARMDDGVRFSNRAMAGVEGRVA